MPQGNAGVANRLHQRRVLIGRRIEAVDQNHDRLIGRRSLPVIVQPQAVVASRSASRTIFCAANCEHDSARRRPSCRRRLVRADSSADELDVELRRRSRECCATQANEQAQPSGRRRQIRRQIPATRSFSRGVVDGRQRSTTELRASRRTVFRSPIDQSAAVTCYDAKPPVL